MITSYTSHFAACGLGYFILFLYLEGPKVVQPNYIGVCKRHHKKPLPHQKENTG